MRRFILFVLAVAATVEWLFTPEPEHDLQELD